MNRIPEENDKPKKAVRVKDRLKSFASGLVLVVFLRLRENPPPDIFLIAIVLFTGIPLVGTLIQKARGREGEPFFANATIQPMQIIQGLFLLVGLVFACFWCYIAASHGGWVLLPFGIGIGLFALWQLISIIRQIIREFRDPGEKHLRSKKDIDPWDRPDKEY